VSPGKAAKCSGGPIKGQGAPVAQIMIEDVWAPDFNSATQTNTAACPSGPTVSFAKTSSFTGLESWGVSPEPSSVSNTPHPSFGPLNAYVATEEPLSASDKAEVEALGGGVATPQTALTIPVAQEAIAVIVHLPSGCTAKSNSAPGRLVLDNVTLEEIFRGEIANWGAIKEDGDELLGCAVTPANDPITRFVWSDPAGRRTHSRST
jgi:hypothetical protein